MKPSIQKGKTGVRMVIDTRRGEYIPMSYMDAAELLFELKDFLRESETGKRCIDTVHERRTRAA